MMRKFYTFSSLFFVLFLTSCMDCYYIENDLHGIWQVVSVEKCATGEKTEAKGLLYYSFQRSMVMLSQKVANSSRRYITHFDLVAPDSIAMGDFRIRTTGEGNYVNDETKVPIDSLLKFGFYQDYTKFHLERSTQKMVFTSDSARIVLRKY